MNHQRVSPREQVANRILSIRGHREILDAAETLEDLRIPPAGRLDREVRPRVAGG
jgi:hypothetical protein